MDQTASKNMKKGLVSNEGSVLVADATDPANQMNSISKEQNTIEKN